MARQYSFPNNHWDWPVKLTHHHAVRAGNLIFTGGQVDLDPKGTVRNIGDLETQCRNSMVYMERLFDDLGVDFNDLVRLVVYFVGDAQDEAFLLDLLAQIIGPTARPAINMIPMPQLCYPDMLTEIEGVAVRSPNGEIVERQCHTLPDLPPLPAAFSHLVQAGDMIFTSDISARNSDGTVAHPNNPAAQTQLTMDRLEQVLALSGAGLDDVVKLTTFTTGDETIKGWATAAALRADRFTRNSPVVTDLPLAQSPAPGQATKLAATAMLGSEPARHTSPDGHWTWSQSMPYAHGTCTGDVSHIGGQVARSETSKVLTPDDMVAQTRTAMANIAQILAQYDATLDDVVKVTTFYQGNASAEALHENLLVRSNSYTPPGPATTGIPVPHLERKGLVIKIEVIAVLDLESP
ncbi:RidA family protein [Falsiruegeria litorea]|uniref:RidA family protein n=1 Tax=Falsiruegeria litorea TaxID=1280831 RepID=UPI001BFD3063|nr:RidA family protein [Falsiruegeria litorea]MBT8169120.1 RidA family protein [Falsiruegeria litorea]